MTIRDFKISDYADVCSWWVQHKEPIPPLELILQNSFVLETDAGIPWICLTLIQFSTPWVAWSAGLVSNPGVPKEGRKEAVKLLWEYVAKEAKNRGYKHLLCIAPNEKLENRYKEMGFIPTKRNQTFMMKELGD